MRLYNRYLTVRKYSLCEYLAPAQFSKKGLILNRSPLPDSKLGKMLQMNTKLERYYLQINFGETWETLYEDEQVEGLVTNLNKDLTSLAGAKARIIGANFDRASGQWLYEQLFFQDLGFGQTETDDVGIVRDQLHKNDEELVKTRERNGEGYGSGESKEDTVDLRLAYVILIAAGFIGVIGFGIRQGFGIFLAPISLEFNFGREIFALAIAIQNLVWGITQPFVGAFADRYGAFKTIAIGVLFYSGGIFLMAESTTPEMFYLSTGVLVGIGLAGSGQSLIMPAVAKRFPANKRSWVLGVVGAAGSFGSFIILPIGQYFISAVGWSYTSVLIGFLLLLIIPLALVFRTPEPAQFDDFSQQTSMGKALKEAFAHRSFWLLCAGFFVCGFHVVYIAVHLPSYVVDLGFSAELGAWALGLIGLMNIIGGYLAGVLGGKFSKKYLLSGLYFGRSLVMAGFVLLPPSEIVVYSFAFFMGLFWLSTVPLTTGLVADLYGTRYMTTLYGIVFFSHQLGAFCGGWLGGYVYDATGSYNLVWWIAVALGLVSMLVHWPIRALPSRQLSPAI